MTQQELEALIAQMGALGPNDFREEVKKEKVKEQASEYAPPTEVEKDVTYRTWIQPGTNRRLTVKVNADGTYTKTFDGADPDIKQPADAAQTPASKRTAREEAEIAANAALPANQDPRSETNAERAARADARIKQQGQDAKDADTRARQQTIDAQSATTAAAQAAAAAQNAETAAAREKREQEAAGRIQDPTTKQWLEKDPTNGSWRPIKTEGVPSGALPADAPQPSGRLGEAAADLQAFDQYLNAQVRSVPPKMTTDQADKLREARRSFWETALSQQQGIVNTQKGVYDSENTARNATMADLSNRRTSATQIADQASSDLMPLMTKMGPNAANGPSLAAAIRASRNNAMDFVTLSGANRMVPPVGMGPALTTVNGMPLPGGTAASPQMGPGFNPRGGPNALGLGAVGSVPAPGGPPPAIFRPQPPAIYPGPAGAPAVATPSAPQPAASAPSPASAGPVDPRSIGAPEPPPTTVPAGTPGMIPQPVNQMPVPVPYPNNAGAESRAPLFAPPTFLAAASRGHVHDPSGVVREMIADPRYDNATLRAVLAEQYPGYDIDALMQGAV